MEEIERAYASEYHFNCGNLFLTQCGNLDDVDRICAFFWFSSNCNDRQGLFYMSGRGHSEFDAMLDLRFKAEQFGINVVVKAIDGILFGEGCDGV